MKWVLIFLLICLADLQNADTTEIYGVDQNGSPMTAAQVVAYWTPERKAAAAAHPLDEGYKHRPSIGANKTNAFSDRPVTQMELTILPYKAVGILYFSNPMGDFACTGFVVNNNGIATASHCVYTKFGVAFNHMFVPAEYNGVSRCGNHPIPFGNIHVNPAFMKTPPNRNFNYDIAFAKVPPSANGMPIGMCTEVINIAMTVIPAVDYPRVIRLLGYPGMVNGVVQKNMWETLGDYSGRTRISYENNFVDVDQIQSGLEEGTSGGPFLDPIPNNYAVGVFSIFDTKADIAFSPIIARWVGDLYQETFM